MSLLRVKLLGGAAALLILGFVAYCHHRDAELLQQGVNQERTRQADSVITVTDTLTITKKVVLAKALSHRDSQLIATRFELSKAGNEKLAEEPVQLLWDSASAHGSATERGSQSGDTTVQHLVRVCNTQIASDSIALAAALSALHTCEANGAAWKAKAQIVQPQPSRVKPFVAGAVTGMAALAAIIHFVK